MSASASAPSGRPILMIPGPIEFHPDVLAKLGEPTPGHISGGFMEEFGASLEMLRNVFASPSGQPLILSGSGTLGWEVIAANLVEKSNDVAATAADVLVVNTGYFSDSWADCCRCFGLTVATVPAPRIGDTVSASELLQALKQNPNVKLVALTHVDTSTAVVNDIKTLTQTVKQFNSNILVAVDGVCSFGGEEFNMDEWGVDAAMTCSQKALGVPPGLCIMMLSPLAVARVEQRQSSIPCYYGNLRNWLPIMRSYEARKPSYFATPNVNLIRALHTALKQIVSAPGGMAERIRLHLRTSDAFKASVTALGLTQVPTSASHAAHTLSAIYFPKGDGVDATKLIPVMMKNGVVVAGGLHKDIKATYFRIGHMSLSVVDQQRKHIQTVLLALENALIESGVKNVNHGQAVKVFEEEMNKTA